jgi:hypothetical protein
MMALSSASGAARHLLPIGEKARIKVFPRRDREFGVDTLDHTQPSPLAGKAVSQQLTAEGFGKLQTWRGACLKANGFRILGLWNNGILTGTIGALLIFLAALNETQQ